MKYKKGDRVSSIKLGYGPDAGKLLKGTVTVGSYGPDNYIRVQWDDGSQDFGFARHFKELKKLKVPSKTYQTKRRSYQTKRKTYASTLTGGHDKKRRAFDLGDEVRLPDGNVGIVNYIRGQGKAALVRVSGDNELWRADELEKYPSQ